MTIAIKKLNEFVHHHLLAFLLAAYALAVFIPSFGAQLRAITIGPCSMPQVMLAWLLFNAGLNIETSKFKKVGRHATLILVGLIANVAIPLIYVFGLSVVGAVWPEADETKVILTGLLISAAMPIAGSSTAWAQNVGGSALISLALVLISTALSPVVTPLTFKIAGLFTDTEVVNVLKTVDAGDSTRFLLWAVVLPSVGGIAVRWLLGDARWPKVAPTLRLSNLSNLLILNYSNAALALPRAFAQPDWDFLVLIVVIVALQCGFSFAMGWYIGKGVKAALPERTALMYGLGMTNNGTGLVLASTHLAAYPLITLPLIFGNLVQQIIAGLVGRWIQKRTRV